MRLTVTGGPHSVEIKLKGSSGRKLKAAKKAALDLLKAAEVQAKRNPLPFGFAISSETQIVDDEEDGEGEG